MWGPKTEMDIGPDQLVTNSVSSYSLSTLVWAPRQTRREVESWAQSDPTSLNMWLRNIRNLSHTPRLRSSLRSGLTSEDTGGGLEDIEANKDEDDEDDDDDEEDEEDEETMLVWEVWAGLEGLGWSGYSTLSSSLESWLD